MNTLLIERDSLRGDILSESKHRTLKHFMALMFFFAFSSIIGMLATALLTHEIGEPINNIGSLCQGSSFAYEIILPMMVGYIFSIGFAVTALILLQVPGIIPLYVVTGIIFALKVLNSVQIS